LFLAGTQRHAEKTLTRIRTRFNLLALRGTLSRQFTAQAEL
jgi:hypothetical protein